MKFVPYKEAVHTVVDIETRGTEPGSVVLSIGAVTLDSRTDDVVESFYESIDMQESIEAGFTCDPSTDQWWDRQDREIKEEAFGGNTKIEDAILSFNGYLLRNSPHYYWGNSHDFDFGILKPYFVYTGIQVPWKFYQLRDIRTYLDHGVITKEDRRTAYSQIPEGRPHHAMWDACYEAILLHMAINTIHDGMIALNELREKSNESR